MIEDTLKKIGLTDKEAQTYLALIKLGPSTAAEIGREVGLPRQTIYTIVESLVDRGYLDQGDRRGVKLFLADPSKLFELIEKQKKTLDEQHTVLERELPKLLERQKRRGPEVRVRYYEGVSGLKRLFNSILDYYRLGKSKEFRGYGVNKFRETALGDYFYEWVRKRHGYSVAAKLFIARGPDDFGITDAIGTYGRTIKHLGMDPQKAGMYLIGDRIYLFSFEDNLGVMVENAAITGLLRSVFDDHWGRVID